MIAWLPRAQWKRLRVGTGTKGPRSYDWARVRVIERREGLPGPPAWVLARRSGRDPTDLTYDFAYAPRSRSLLTLAQVARTRYTVEHVIKEAKSEGGVIAMRFAPGTAGIGTVRLPCWPRSGWLTSGW